MIRLSPNLSITIMRSVSLFVVETATPIRPCDEKIVKTHTHANYVAVTRVYDL